MNVDVEASPSCECTEKEKTIKIRHIQVIGVDVLKTSDVEKYGKYEKRFKKCVKRCKKSA